MSEFNDKSELVMFLRDQAHDVDIDNEELAQDLNKAADLLTSELVFVESSEYERMKDEIDFLECLEAAGVDNWPGYGDAVDMHDEEDE